MPPRWLGMYSDFITKNSSAVSQIESALRSLTYIIPGDTYSALARALSDVLTTSRSLPGVRDRVRIMYVFLC